MRSLAPSMTLTCTLIVSPGLKAGRSSRSDVLSTKSSVFIRRHFLAVAATCRCSPLRAGEQATQPMDSDIWESRGGRWRAGRPTSAGDNWSIVPDRAHAAKSRDSLRVFLPQVGTAFAGALLGCLAPPGLDAGVIAGQQHLGNIKSA